MTKAPIEGTPRALVVADQKLANVLALALNHGRYETLCVTTIADAERQLVAFRPQLLIVSIDLDRERALALVGKRIAGRRIPTIALTTRGGLAVKLAAFDRGVDDLMVVPFFPEELVARVIALMRRTYGESVPFIPVIKIAGLEVDLLNQRVRKGKARLELTAIEQALLYLFASNPGQIIGRDEILDTIWGRDFVAESNIVDRHVKNLRTKLEDDPHRPQLIATVPGKGYRFLGKP